MNKTYYTNASTEDMRKLLISNGYTWSERTYSERHWDEIRKKIAANE